jgi:hypothetical protein
MSQQPMTYFGRDGMAVKVNTEFTPEESAELERAIAVNDFATYTKIMESKIQRLTPEESETEWNNSFGKAFAQMAEQAKTDPPKKKSKKKSA